MLLTTTGRRTGRHYTTPLQYEEIDGLFYVLSARGQKADWFRNIAANGQVEVRVKTDHFTATAEAVTDAGRIADILEVRLQRHPRMIGAMLRGAHLPAQPDRDQLEEYAGTLAMVVITPERR